MIDSREIIIVSLLGLLTTSSSIFGAALGLYFPLSKRILACVLAFAAGALINGLAIELAFEGAQELHQQGFDVNAAWAFVGSGFALGSVIYYFTSLFLDQKGAAIRYPTRFREYALGRKQRNAKKTIQLLSNNDSGIHPRGGLPVRVAGRRRLPLRVMARPRADVRLNSTRRAFGNATG